VAAHSWSVVVQVLKLFYRQRHLTKSEEARKAGPMLDPATISPTFRIRPALMTRRPRNNSPDTRMTSCGLLSTKQVVVCSLSPAMMLLLCMAKWETSYLRQHVLINSGQRCSYLRQIAFSHQCCHQLCTDGKLDLAKYSPRWLNHKSFNETVTSFNLQFPPAETATNSLSTAHHHPTPAVSDDDPPFPNNFSDDTNNSAHEESEDAAPSFTTKSHDTSKHGKVTYQYVLEKASILVQLAQSDPATLTTLCHLLEQLTSRLCNSQSIVVQSYDMSLPFGKETQYWEL
jgi:hypothetical protein